MTGKALAVTMVTAHAGQDALSGEDYREIYDEVRGLDEATGKYGVSLDEFVALVGSAFTKAAWSKYHRGELALNRVMRNELRGAVGLGLLPATVAEAVAGVDADALVVQVGAGTPDRVVMVAGGEPVVVAVNGSVAAWSGEIGDWRLEIGDWESEGGKTTGRAGGVTAVTRARKGVFVATGVFDRVNAVRQRCGLSWAEVLEAAERALAGHAVSVAEAGAGGAVGAPVGQVLD